MSAPKPCLHSLYLAFQLVKDLLDFEKENIENLEGYEKASFKVIVYNMSLNLKELYELLKK